MLHEDFMELAAAEAEQNLTENAGGPFGAIVVSNGQVVGRGHNRVLAEHDPTCHAEIEAIRAACRQLGTHDLSGCILYTSCYPCPMCLGAIVWANIKTVYYGNTPQDAAAIGFRDDYIYKFIEDKCSDWQVLELQQLGHDKTLPTFERFKNKADKIIY